MYSPTYRTDPQLAEQNTLRAWIDCNLRPRPRPHRFVPDVVPDWWKCTRCPVSTRTSKPVPNPWLGLRRTYRKED